jgi:hypothetical protein
MEWFMDKIDRGGCYVPNPFSGKPYYISLETEDVLLLNYWTKNPSALLPFTGHLRERGYAQAFFISITGYPRWLEANVPSPEDSARAIRSLSSLLGKEALWWRYDPILLTENLNAVWHQNNFTALCEKIWAGNTDRVIISLAHIDGPYRIIRTTLSAACCEQGDSLNMPSYDEFITLALSLRDIADSFGITLEICCSPEIREEDRAFLKQGACLSRDYLERIIPDLPLLKSKGTRKRSSEHGYAPCGCLASRDIGAAGTCTHGCVYCYANRNSRPCAPGKISASSPWLSPLPLPIPSKI